jgi:hypothetical protein
MDIDDPTKPEFASWDSYERFASRVRSDRRFATDAASRAFINTVLATVPLRGMSVTQGQLLYRAQLGIDEEEIKKDGEVVAFKNWGYPAERMKPVASKVGDGRANPVGIAFLYLASAIQTAISEIRPWIGSKVSVAQFRVMRDLRIVNLTLGHGQFGLGLLSIDELVGQKMVSADTKRRAVWTEIDNAFSRPVTRSEDAVGYVPTQILAEAFRESGYDGVVYRSNFGNPEYNVALFDLDSAEVVNCAPYAIKQIKIEFEEDGDRWFKRDEAKG